MDRNTAQTIDKHLDVTRANLNLAGYTPVELSLPFLEDALHNLEAAIDTLKLARAERPTVIGQDLAIGQDATVFVDLTTKGREFVITNTSHA